MPRRPLAALAPVPLLLLLTLLLSGCPAAKTVVATGHRETDAALERLRQSYLSTPDLTLKGELAISDAPVTILFDALVRSRDSLRVDLVGPFAIPIGSLSATHDRFLFFNVQEGTATEGTPDRKTFSKMLLLDMGYDEMISMLRGEIPRIPLSSEYTADWSGDRVTYHVALPAGEEHFTLDTSDLTVDRYARSKRVGDSLVEEFSLRFDLYYPLGGRRFPKKIAVSIAGGERTVGVKVTGLADAIDPARSIWLGLPEGVERKEFDPGTR